MPGCSQPGPAVTVSVPMPPPPTPPPPGPPRVQVYQPTSPNTARMDVSWDPVPGATYYKVLLDGNEVTTVQGATSTQITVTPGRTYRISIVACN